MATIKIFSADGVKELNCFDTLSEVPYLVEEDTTEDEPVERDPFEDE